MLALPLCAPAAPGDLDLTFDPGSGLDGYVAAVAVQPDGKLIIGGSFTTVAGLMRNQVARLNPDGTGDPSFDARTLLNDSPDLVPATVWCTALQPDGKVLIAGSFTKINEVVVNRIARLNANGSLDTSFNTGTGANGLVNSIVLQPDGKILIGGYFSAVNNTHRQHVARVDLDGTVDTSFDPENAIGDWDLVNALALQPDGKLLVGSGYSGLLVRLNPDGSTDPSFARREDDQVYAIALQRDGKIVIGGRTASFTTNAGRDRTIESGRKLRREFQRRQGL
jgi:uncharacterized delta-60 repeat protein